MGAGITGDHTQHRVLLVCGNIVKHAYSACSFLVCLMYIALVTKIIALLPVTHSAVIGVRMRFILFSLLIHSKERLHNDGAISWVLCLE
jgi:hypothetical protein